MINLLFFLRAIGMAHAFQSVIHISVHKPMLMINATIKSLKLAMVDPNILSEHILPAWAMLNLRSRPCFGFRVNEKFTPTIDLMGFNRSITVICHEKSWETWKIIY